MAVVCVFVCVLRFLFSFFFFFKQKTAYEMRISDWSSDVCSSDLVLGLWLEQNEGAKFWLRVMNELRNRGVEDILLAVVDGLKGFPDAITAVFPETIVQTCIVHLLR